MTAGDDAALPPKEKRSRTHRLKPAEEIIEKFIDKAGVADWILAVREELVRGLGDVDTLSKFARVLTRNGCKDPVRKLRRRFSGQLNTAPGPSSTMAGKVLRHVVSGDRFYDVRDRFAVLYQHARGEPAPFATLTRPDVPAPRRPLEERPVEGLTIDELRELVVRLKERAAAQPAAVQEPSAAGSRDAQWTTPRRPGRSRPSWSAAAGRRSMHLAVTGLSCPSTRRYVVLSPRPQPAPVGPAGHVSVRDSLEDYWLGETWTDLRRQPALLETVDVDETFDGITGTLAREGIGTSCQTAPTADEVCRRPDGSGRSWWRRFRSRLRPRWVAEPVPREWTSRGPWWYYSLLGGVAAGGLAVVLLVASPEPTPAPVADNPLVPWLEEQFSPMAPSGEPAGLR